MNRSTIREAWMTASSFLLNCGITEARFEAEVLLRAVLDLDRAQFFSRMPELFALEHQQRLEHFLHRRAQGEPIQYILGKTEFYGRSFCVNPAVLIPRPETEGLIEQLIAHTKEMRDQSLHVFEVGVGSGVISITLALEMPQWKVTAIDISHDALEVARSNARMHGVEGRIQWVQGEYLDALVEDEKIDILVSNPPYIPSECVQILDREVMHFEPRIALDGGEDGLDPYREIVQQLVKRDAPSRMICFEIGAEQGEAVRSLICNSFSHMKVEVYPDLAGRDRVVIGSRG